MAVEKPPPRAPHLVLWVSCLFAWSVSHGSAYYVTAPIIISSTTTSRGNDYSGGGLQQQQKWMDVRQKQTFPRRRTLAIRAQENEESNSNFLEVERPDPTVLLANQKDTTQKGGVIAIGVGILGGTALLVDFCSFLSDSLPLDFLESFLGFTIPLLLGLLYAALGVTHFIYKDGYAAIVPPKGTWGGLWNVPAPYAEKLGLSYEDYHVLWTGVAEIGGGLLFALGGLNAFPLRLASFLLFLLTLAVTPANIYMFTHDAQLSFAPPTPYPSGHFIRGVLQCILLSIFWLFAFH